MALIGYARNDADDPSGARQIRQLEETGCRIIFHDTPGSEDENVYPELIQALTILAVGDVLVISRLARASHSLPRLFGVILDIRERGADLWAIEDDLDTRTEQGGSIFRLIATLNSFEGWHLNRRTRLRTATSKRRGSKPGRKLRVTPEILAQARELIGVGKSIRQAAAQLDVSKTRLHEALRAEEVNTAGPVAR